MARYERTYDGERRTVKRSMKLTPSEAAELDAAAAQQGATWSDFARELLFRRLAAPSLVGGTRRNPEAAAIIRSLDAAAYENSANGNNLNQIARHLNTTGELRDWAELRAALDRFNKASDLHVAALERVLAL